MYCIKNEIIMTRTSLLLLVLLAFIGCKNGGMSEDVDATNEFMIKLQSAPLDEMDNYPEWLSLKIAEIESWEKDKSILKVRIFRGEWENRTVYFITNNLKSCVLCEVYHEAGEIITLNEENIEEFCKKSAYWTTIYEYGDALNY
jgi:hypothetical protein